MNESIPEETEHVRLVRLIKAELDQLNGKLPVDLVEDLKNCILLAAESAAMNDTDWYFHVEEANNAMRCLQEVLERSFPLKVWAGYTGLTTGRNPLKVFGDFLERTLANRPTTHKRRGPKIDWFKPMIALNVAKMLKKYGVPLKIYDNPKTGKKSLFALAVSQALKAMHQSIADTRPMLRAAKKHLEWKEDFDREASKASVIYSPHASGKTLVDFGPLPRSKRSRRRPALRPAREQTKS